MKSLRVVLLIVLAAVVCFMAALTRWHISVDGEWRSLPGKLGALAINTRQTQVNTYPDLPVTRMDFIMVLGRELGLKQEPGPVSFSDVKPDSAGAQYIYPAIKAGVLKGYPDLTLRPGDFITKNEAEIMVSSALRRTPPAYDGNSPILTREQMSRMMSGLKTASGRQQ